MRFIFLLVVGCAFAGTAMFADPVAERVSGDSQGGESFRKGTRITGAAGGLSFGTSRYGGDVAHDMAVFQVQYGTIVSEVMAEGRFFSGRIALAGEFTFAQQFRPGSAVLFGATPLVRYLFETEGRWKPFVEGGAGIAYTDIGGPSLGGNFQFSPQFGAGVYWFLQPELALVTQHRFVHYSNASMRSPNVGINQHIFLLGLTRFH